MPDTQDQELLDDFVAESTQALEEIERDLLALETEGAEDKELINRIFRTVHSMKGSGGYLGLERIVHVAHLAETLLDKVRNDECDVTSEVTDAVLNACDTLVSMVESDDYGASFEISDTVSKLNHCLGIAGSEQGADKSKLSKSGNITPKDIDTALAKSDGPNAIYLLRVSLAKLHAACDIKEGVVEAMNSVGKILHATIPIEEIDKTVDGTCVLFYQTVLEPDLISFHLGIPAESIEKLDPNAAPAMETEEAASKPEPAAAPAADAPATESANAPPPGDKPAAANHAAPAQKNASGKAGSGKGGNAEKTMRVPVRILNELLEWTGNMVMARNQLLNEFDFSGNAAFRTLSAAITGVHETVIETRMQTTGTLFEKYQRVIRDLSRQLGKEVQLRIEGGDLELDRTILESFADPLTHLIRNSLDHGIENPAEREQAGKNRQATIYLRSYQQSGEIILEVEDDGRGIDHEKIAQVALSRGVVTAEELVDMPENKRLALIFEPGFSTKDQASDISGRGVGMDVVKTNLESVGGTIDISTTVGKGTVIATRLPLAKALVSSSLTAALVVRIGEERFAIPETAVSEVIRRDASTEERMEVVDGRYVLQLRDQLIPVISLDAFVAPKPGENPLARKSARNRGELNEGTTLNQCLVVLTHRRHIFAVMVEEAIGIQEIIVRSSPQLVKKCSLYSGHTVMGDGRVAMILDVNGIVNTMGLEFTEKQEKRSSSAASAVIEQHANSSASDSQRMLIFDYGAQEYFAIPLELVSIIERFDPADIHRVGDQEYFQLKNETISLLRLNNFLPISDRPQAAKDWCLVRPSIVDFPIGILTGPDLSIVEVAANFETRIDNKQGVVGTFNHNGCLVMLLDLYSVFERHAPDKISSQEVKTGPANILLAEDSMFFRKLVAQYARHDLWNLTMVNDGAEAWELLQEQPTKYQLVISDINMPRKDGFELVRLIREDRRFDRVPVVALTTLAQEEYRRKGLELGFDRYVVKINKHEIRQTIAECLELRKQRGE